MKLLSGKRIGQSGYELALAVFFSFFLHAALIALALIVVTAIKPRVFIPPHYEVKLVGQPADMAPAPASAPQLPKEEAAPARETPKPKAKKAPPRRTKTASKKAAVPELSSQQKAKPATPEEPKSGPAAVEQPAFPPGSEKTAGKAEGVAVASSSQDFKFPFYLGTIREKIEQNWNPPPGVKGIKAKVLFRVLRGGRVDNANSKLQESSGNFYFDQAAMRAILLSSPFPPMPEGFYKDYAEFSVDLIEQE